MPPYAPLRYPIQDSVGRSGRNLIVDVMTVKTMLNAKRPVPLQFLDVNGLCDWQTIDAIETYQRYNLRMTIPSGRIDPGDATHLSLNVREILAHPSKKYTSSPNEVSLEKTKPTPRQVIDMLLES